MSGTIRSTVGRWIAALGIAVAVAACSEAPTGPQGAITNTAAIAVATASQDVDLGSCSKLAAPEGARLMAHYYATGVQGYWWSGSAWVFIGPTADLFADKAYTAKVGTHYAGPTWVSTSGSGVVGRVFDKCSVDPNSIPWLLLTAVSSRGPGIFDGTTHIQRVHTVGGNAPSAPGSYVGQEEFVPYTAEYYFYRAPS